MRLMFSQENPVKTPVMFLAPEQQKKIIILTAAVQSEWFRSC